MTQSEQLALGTEHALIEWRLSIRAGNRSTRRHDKRAIEAVLWAFELQRTDVCSTWRRREYRWKTAIITFCMSLEHVGMHRPWTHCSRPAVRGNIVRRCGGRI